MKFAKLEYFETQLLNLQADCLGVNDLIHGVGDDTADMMVGIVKLDQNRVGRLSRMDAIQQQAMLQAGEVRRKNRLLEIKAALERIDDGVYGECSECLQAIPEARLEVDPAVEYCVKCCESLA